MVQLFVRTSNYITAVVKIEMFVKVFNCKRKKAMISRYLNPFAGMSIVLFYRVVRQLFS